MDLRFRNKNKTEKLYYVSNLLRNNVNLQAAQDKRRYEIMRSNASGIEEVLPDNPRQSYNDIASDKTENIVNDLKLQNLSSQEFQKNLHLRLTNAKYVKSTNETNNRQQNIKLVIVNDKNATVKKPKINNTNSSGNLKQSRSLKNLRKLQNIQKNSFEFRPIKEMSFAEKPKKLTARQHWLKLRTAVMVHNVFKDKVRKSRYITLRQFRKINLKKQLKKVKIAPPRPKSEKPFEMTFIVETDPIAANTPPSISYREYFKSGKIRYRKPDTGYDDSNNIATNVITIKTEKSLDVCSSKGIKIQAERSRSSVKIEKKATSHSIRSARKKLREAKAKKKSSIYYIPKNELRVKEVRSKRISRSSMMVSKIDTFTQTETKPKIKKAKTKQQSPSHSSVRNVARKSSHNVITSATSSSNYCSRKKYDFIIIRPNSKKDRNRAGGKRKPVDRQIQTDPYKSSESDNINPDTSSKGYELTSQLRKIFPKKERNDQSSTSRTISVCEETQVGSCALKKNDCNWVPMELDDIINTAKAGRKDNEIFIVINPEQGFNLKSAEKLKMTICDTATKNTLASFWIMSQQLDLLREADIFKKYKVELNNGDLTELQNSQDMKESQESVKNKKMGRIQDILNYLMGSQPVDNIILIISPKDDDQTLIPEQNYDLFVIDKINKRLLQKFEIHENDIDILQQTDIPNKYVTVLLNTPTNVEENLIPLIDQIVCEAEIENKSKVETEKIFKPEIPKIQMKMNHWNNVKIQDAINEIKKNIPNERIFFTVKPKYENSISVSNMFQIAANDKMTCQQIGSFWIPGYQLEILKQSEKFSKHEIYFVKNENDIKNLMENCISKSFRKNENIKLKTDKNQCQYVPLKVLNTINSIANGISDENVLLIIKQKQDSNDKKTKLLEISVIEKSTKQRLGSFLIPMDHLILLGGVFERYEINLMGPDLMSKKKQVSEKSDEKAKQEYCDITENQIPHIPNFDERKCKNVLVSHKNLSCDSIAGSGDSVNKLSCQLKLDNEKRRLIIEMPKISATKMSKWLSHSCVSVPTDRVCASSSDTIIGTKSSMKPYKSLPHVDCCAKKLPCKGTHKCNLGNVTTPDSKLCRQEIGSQCSQQGKNTSCQTNTHCSKNKCCQVNVRPPCKNVCVQNLSKQNLQKTSTVSDNKACQVEINPKQYQKCNSCQTEHSFCSSTETIFKSNLPFKSSMSLPIMKNSNDFFQENCKAKQSINLNPMRTSKIESLKSKTLCTQNVENKINCIKGNNTNDEILLMIIPSEQNVFRYDVNVISCVTKDVIGSFQISDTSLKVIQNSETFLDYNIVFANEFCDFTKDIGIICSHLKGLDITKDVKFKDINYDRNAQSIIDDNKAEEIDKPKEIIIDIIEFKNLLKRNNSYTSEEINKIFSYANYHKLKIIIYPDYSNDIDELFVVEFINENGSFIGHIKLINDKIVRQLEFHENLVDNVSVANDLFDIMGLKRTKAVLKFFTNIFGFQIVYDRIALFTFNIYKWL